MKKIFLLLLFLPSIAFAQIKVNADGSVQMGNQSSNAIKVKVGGSGYFPSLSLRAGLYAVNDTISEVYNIGALGESFVTSNSTTTNKAIGVLGFGGGLYSGNNFGVIGVTANYMGQTAANGASIYGSSHLRALTLTDKYAAYFDGPAYVYGTLTCTQLNYSSDIRLKENVADLCKTGESALGSVMAMNALRYNYKKRNRDCTYFVDSEATRTQAEEYDQAQAEKIHFGLSAQELQTIYPNLVNEDAEGYLSINYVELVPVLIRSIQELKAELDEMKGADGTMRKAAKGSMQDETLQISGTSLQNAKLYQNTPNPFTERTEIRFTLPDDAQNAYIYIFDMQGKMLRQIPVDPSMQSVTINGYELSAGIYLYSLAVNGQEIDTKRMILSK